MERSRVTVEFSHLPGQIFEHEANGVYCVTTRIEGPPPEDLRLATVLEALEHTLDRWASEGGIHVGFPMPVTDHDDEFRIVVPRTVEFDVWPATMFCSDRGCGHVLRVNNVNDLPSGRRCTQCRRGTYGQLPYFQVHSCGNRRELTLPPCPDHNNRSIGFEDSGSFYTARFRCLECRRPLDVQFRQCSCMLDWRQHDPSERRLDPVTARDSRAFFGHHLTLVSVGGTRLTDALRAPKGIHFALGHYAGTVTSLRGLEDEARGRRQSADDSGLAALQQLRSQHPDLSEDILATLTSALHARRGDDPALEQTEHLLAAQTLEFARLDRRVMERAFLFAECDVDELNDISTSMRNAGHAQLADRLDKGRVGATNAGIATVNVVRDFPVALVGYGYTREHASPDRARLAPLPHDRQDTRLPLVAIETRTEGILVELAPLTLWQWCARNGWCPPPSVDTPEEVARAWLLDQTYAEPETDTAAAIRRVTHAYSHLLMHALAYHSSYSSNSVAEYLLERQASTLIYVAKYSSFNLGGLATLAEQHLQRWVDSATSSAWSCVHDPICLSERGGCHKCLAVTFGCERFNKGLDRGYLVGGGPQDIREGYLFTAQQVAP